MKSPSGHAEHVGDAAADTGRPGTPTTMRAIVQDAYGEEAAETLRLERIDRPEVGDEQVLVRVGAASVHIGDWHVMTGSPYLMRIMGFGFRGPKARVRGMDVAGTVEAVGAKVSGFRTGDEVFGTCEGAFAEYAVAREKTLALKPADLSFEQAAAVPTSAATALQALRDVGEVRPEQKVLIVGASGGVGLFAVQIAKALGAEVTGVCSAEKAHTVGSVGADHVVDYARDDFTRSGLHYDLILDMGGTRSLSDLRRALSPRGTLVLVGGEGGGRLVGGAMVRSLRALLLSPFVRQRLRMVVATTKTADLEFLSNLLVAGKVTPVIDQAYPLDKAADAICHLHAGHARGKLVITV